MGSNGFSLGDNLIDYARLEAFESISDDGQYTFTVSPAGSVSSSLRGEIIGVRLLDFAPGGANCYVKITDSVVTGDTGTILSLKPSGTTPIFYPTRALAVSYDGVYLGSPTINTTLPVVGDLTITVGSIGSPVVFSGLDIYYKK